MGKEGGGLWVTDENRGRKDQGETENSETKVKTSKIRLGKEAT